MNAERLNEVLERKSLAQGSHTADGIMCVMEAAAYIAGEPWSDAPACVCPSIRDFMVGWNDGLPNNAARDRLLKPLLSLVINTRATEEIEMQRRWMAFDWLVRDHTAAWMDLTQILKPHADALRALPEMTEESLSLAVPVLMATHTAAAAAGAAAWGAAGAAAAAAAWGAARDATWGAAWGAARGAARGAAGDAARGAAWAAAWGAARGAARGAAWDAAGDALSPTVTRLQDSAQDLVRRMCAVGKETR